SVVAYVLEGAIRSKVNDGPVTVYQAGESWIEPPGAAHSVSANASATEPELRRAWTARFRKLQPNERFEE
ncbi:MAG: cupin domain-containing protein, partial [Geminicoccaceae bacterium]